MKTTNSVKISWGFILAAIAVICLAVLPVAGMPRSWTIYLFLFFIYLAMANMWNLIAGYSGLISLCQPAFSGYRGILYCHRHMGQHTLVARFDRRGYCGRYFRDSDRIRGFQADGNLFFHRYPGNPRGSETDFLHLAARRQ